MRISEDQSIPNFQDEKNSKNPDYWGWYDYKEQKFTLIFPKRFLLDMCFPYLIAWEEKWGTGKAYRLQIINNFLLNTI